jgi:DEAD/DEAH box helicase domain-containing protein
MLNEVIFDLETKSFFVEDGKFDPSKFGVSVVSLYTRKLDENFKEVEGEMRSYWEEEFAQMWPVFQAADRIIGFNSLGFDVPALRPYAPSSFAKLPHFDILDEVKKATGHKTSLHKIAKATLGIQKTDTGENAVLYWEKHDPKSLALLQKYCQDDVEITKKIYDFALKNKKLFLTDYWNNPREIKFDFAYSPGGISLPPQASLF